MTVCQRTTADLEAIVSIQSPTHAASLVERRHSPATVFWIKSGSEKCHQLDPILAYQTWMMVVSMQKEPREAWPTCADG